MTLIYRVCAYLKEHGPCFPDAMHPAFPELTKTQLLNALKNGAIRGKCHVVDRIRHPTKRGWIAMWADGPAEQEWPKAAEAPLPPRGDYGIPKVSSVFDLAGGV